MLVILKNHNDDGAIRRITDRIEDTGLRAQVNVGESKTVIGVVGGNGERLNPLEATLRAMHGDVAEVIRISAKYKLASREWRKEDTVVRVGGVEVGGGKLAMIAGPCAVESAEQMRTIAAAVKASGANILRGGAFKPRTGPYSFQGLGEEGLKLLRDAGEESGMPAVTEVMDPREVELVERYADMLQVGARNMQNYRLLREVGKAKKPVLLKRGISATVEETLLAAEYILDGGNDQVAICERGAQPLDRPARRYTFDLGGAVDLRVKSHLPVIADPSHATGRPDLIPQLALASVAAGLDGVHVEVHHQPEKARSDGDQALRPDEYDNLMRQVLVIAQAVGKTVPEACRG